jgi:putative redox protein
VAGESKRIALTWEDGLRFRGGEPGGPTILVDGDNAASPGPMLTLLLAAASCSGSDVVSILEKMRMSPREFRIEASGRRQETDPRRFLSIHFVYQLAGPGLEEAKVRRAIELSLQKYCSVIHSLAPDIAITYDLTLA